MGYFVGMDVNECLQYFKDYFYRQGLGKGAQFNDLIEEFAALEVLRNDIPFILRLVVLINLDDVGMVEFLQKLQLIDRI